MRKTRQLLWIPILALLVAVLPMPYEYYMIIRLAIPVFALVIAVNEFKEEQSNIYPYVFLGLATLYNPVLPIHLTKTLWIVINLLSAYVFYFYKGVFDQNAKNDK